MRTSLNFCAFVLSFLSSFSQAESAKQTLENVLTLGNQSGLAVSAEMRRVSDGKVLFSMGSQRPLIPASTTKLLLSSALLANLSPNFRMQTRFYRTGPLKKGRVDGDLIVVGDGDPFLVSEELFLIASELHLLGYKEFTGDLIVDNSLFVNETYSKEQNKARGCAMRAFDAPVSALGVNFNSLTVAISPAEKVGEYALANLEPFPLKGVKIKNEIRTILHGATKIQSDCKVESDGTLEITVRGQVQHGGRVQRLYRSLPETEKLAGVYIQSFFNHLGIQIRGKVREGKQPAKAELILSHDSKPIADLVKSLCQYSSNYMADVLLKRMAVEAGRPGSFAEGVNVLAMFLSAVGVKDPYVLKDGSGLSYQTRLSAEQLTKILLYAARDFRIFPDFLASLPNGGETGTLKGRFHFNEGDDLRGNVRAKTGTLSEPVTVSALAGYLQHQSFGLVSFAILQNGVETKPQPNLTELQQSQEKALAFFGKNFKGNDKHGL